MFLHRVKMNWKKHRTLNLTILLVALARIVLENAFGEVPLDGSAALNIGVEVSSRDSGLGVSQNLLGIGDRLLQEALHLRGCIAQILPRLLEQNGGSVNGTGRLTDCQVVSQSGPGSLEPGQGKFSKNIPPATGREGPRGLPFWL